MNSDDEKAPDSVRQARLLLHDALDRFVPAAAQADVVDLALRRAEQSQVPDAPRELAAFALGPLCAAVEQRVGPKPALDMREYLAAVLGRYR